VFPVSLVSVEGLKQSRTSSLQSRCRSSLPGDESAQGLSGQVNTGRTLCHHPKPSPSGRFALRAVRPSRGIIRYAHPSGRTELRALLRYAPFLQAPTSAAFPH